MCAILDANVKHELGTQQGQAGAFFYEWLLIGGGKIVIGGTKLRNELYASPDSSYSRLFEELRKVFTTNGETRSRATISTGPVIFEGQGGTVLDILDVIGLPDDSTRGYRIEVGASPGVEDWMQVPIADAGPFTLQYVITTPICYNFRGASAEGFCN